MTESPDAGGAAQPPKPRRPPRLRFDDATHHLAVVLSSLDVEALDAPRREKADSFRAVTAAARGARRRGVALPLDDFLRESGLDGGDRLLFLALLRAAVEGKNAGGATLAEIAALLGVPHLPGRIALRTRLEETFALRAAGFVESNADSDLEARLYRLSPRLVERLVERLVPAALAEPRDEPPPASSEARVASALAAAANPARLPDFLFKGLSFWSPPLPGRPGWDRGGLFRAELARNLSALREAAAEPIGRVLAEERLDGPEALVLALLVDAAARGQEPPAFVLADAAFEPGADATVALGPSGRLARAGLLRFSTGAAGVSFRTVSLTPAARERLGVVAAPAVSGKPAADGDDEGPIVERVDPRHRLADVVLAPGARLAVEELLFRLGDGAAVLHEWGLGGPASGAAARLHGPPGTGKTFTAEALAGQLGRPLVRLRIESALSRWVGQGERRVAAAFAGAATERAVLFLDEADALLVDRADARSWQVSLVNVLLVEIERYPGLVVLATNRASALDPALERRLALRLELAPPGEAERLELWRRCLPARAPLAPDVDLVAAARDDAPAIPARPLGFRREESPARPEPRLLRTAA